MFEVGFTELLLIFALALVVLGPRRLPELATKIGRWVGKARAMARQLREQLDQEVSLEETEEQRRMGQQAASTSPTPSPPPPPLPDLSLDSEGKPYYPPEHHAAEPQAVTEPASPAPEASNDSIEPTHPQQTVHERRGT